VVDTLATEPSIEDIPILQEYPDVFPKETPSMPPIREASFCINLAPGDVLISKAPYRMTEQNLKN